ncbi:MAG: TonB family protein [Sandaracinaceae bacterium]
MNQQPMNPFERPVTPPVTDAPESWGLAASGPPLNPAEVETTEDAVEVVVMWGDSDVLHVEHVRSGREVAVGESSDCAFLLGEDVLGLSRLPVVVAHGGRPACVIPEGATGRVQVGDSVRTFEDLDLVPYQGLAGAQLYPLPAGATAWVQHQGFTFLVRPTLEARDVAGAAPVSLRRYGWVGLSLGVHAILLMMFYFMPPSSRALSLDQINEPSRLAAYLDTADATEDEELPAFMEEEDSSTAGGTGERAADEEGAAGDETAEVNDNHYAIRNRDNSEHRLARDQVRTNMDQIGAIGALAALTNSWQTMTSPYGADTPNGPDALDAVGRLTGAQAGVSFGNGGAGMRGTGRGAGGTGLGTLGLGRLGTIGRGNGRGDGDGYGDGVGLGNGRRASRIPPRITTGSAQVVGGLSREAIRRVVRRHLSEVRFCYEQGLQQNPSIEGRVTVSFMISPTGAVQSSTVGSSSLGNTRVESCVANAVRRWSFPTPDGGGPVGVNYPFVLQSAQ